MRHRHRTTLHNLLSKQRRHTARRPNHIHQPHRRVSRMRKHRHLSNPLRRTHDAVRSHRFIRRYQNHPPHAVFVCQPRQPTRTQRVRLHRRKGIPFHQRHMLQRGRMQNDLRPMLLEHRRQQRVIAHAPQHRNRTRTESSRRHCAVDIEQRLLCNVEQHDLPSARGRKNLRHLRPDESACTRHQHTPPSDMGNHDRIGSRCCAPQNLRPGGSQTKTQRVE